jgi:hypothetical protein
MHIEPLHYPRASDARERLRGLPIVALDRDADLSATLKLLEQGARQVLAVADGNREVQRKLIYVEPSSSGRDAALAAAASLARHLTIDVTMLVRDEEASGVLYRDLLDLRNASLKMHGLDIRTETFRGSVRETIKERLASTDEQMLLVVGLTSPEACSDLIDDLTHLLRESPPAAVLFVSGRDDQDVLKPATVATYATAWAL